MKVYIIRCDWKWFRALDRLEHTLTHGLSCTCTRTRVYSAVTFICCRFNNFLRTIAVTSKILCDSISHTTMTKLMHICISISTLKFIVFDANPVSIALLYGVYIHVQMVACDDASMTESAQAHTHVCVTSINMTFNVEYSRVRVCMWTRIQTTYTTNHNNNNNNNRFAIAIIKLTSLFDWNGLNSFRVHLLYIRLVWFDVVTIHIV